MKHLFCISSPFQADSARRIVEYFNISADDSIFLLFDSAFKRDRERVKASLGWLYDSAVVREIDYKTSFFIKRLLFIWKEAPSSLFIVYVGDWNNKLPKFFSLHPKFSGFKAMDDGLSSFTIAEKVQNKSSFYCLFKRLKPEFITRYEISKLCPSFSVNVLPSMGGSKDFSNSVLVIGSALAEKGIMSKGDYKDFLKKIEEKFKEQKLVYYPHRSEVNRDFGSAFEVIEPELPIEHWFGSLEKPPGTIVSLFSSALVNIKADYPGVCVYYHEPDTSVFINSGYDFYKIYREIEKNPNFIRL